MFCLNIIERKCLCHNCNALCFETMHCCITCGSERRIFFHTLYLLRSLSVLGFSSVWQLLLACLLLHKKCLFRLMVWALSLPGGKMRPLETIEELLLSSCQQVKLNWYTLASLVGFRLA